MYVSSCQTGLSVSNDLLINVVMREQIPALCYLQLCLPVYMYAPKNIYRKKNSCYSDTLIVLALVKH